MKKPAIIVIPLIQSILEKEVEPLIWTKGVFHSLRSITHEGLYSIVILNNSQFDEKQLFYIEETLIGESICIESIVTSTKDLNVDTNLSITLVETPLRLKYMPFTSWNEILPLLVSSVELKERLYSVTRETKETSISLSVNLDGSGKSRIDTHIPFLDHMMDQIAKHGRIDITLICNGDIDVDEHHSVEDVAIVLGEAVLKALGDKMGIRRYGSMTIPMDDVTSVVAIDFSNRPYFVWNVDFSREMVGSFPTEMVYHFFKSFSDEARCNVHMSVTKGNTHHQVEALFKAFARAIREAVFRYPGNTDLPSTKGVL
jgi:imidazoleglycerol phosphate dehydratase HisB